MSHRAEIYVGTVEAGRLLNRSPQIVYYWGLTKKLPSVRRRPTFLFKISDVIDFQSRMPAPRPGRGRPRSNQVDKIVEEILR